MAQRYASSHDVGPVTKDVLGKWEYVLERLARDPMELSREIDWVIKKKLIESFMERKGLAWDDSRVHMLDLQYHDSRPDKGLYYMLEREGRVERIVSDDEITAAIRKPPEDTRAYFRGECLRRYPSQVFGVNWDSISFSLGDKPIKRVMMAEPLKGTRNHVEGLFAASTGAKELVENLSG